VLIGAQRGPGRRAMRVVAPGFAGIACSRRHQRGIAVRLPRGLRWRRAKPVEQAYTPATLAAGSPP